jgi:hypothetical protein
LKPLLIDIKTLLNGLDILVAQNCGTYWNYRSEYQQTCNDLIPEYEGNPIRDNSDVSFLTMFQRHLETQNAGNRYWLSSASNSTAGGGTISAQDVLYGNLCEAMLIGNPSTRITLQNFTGPNVPGWENTIKSPAEDVADLLQVPVQDPELIDPVKHLYRRMYPKGAVYCRPYHAADGSVLNNHLLLCPPQSTFIMPDGTFKRYNVNGVPSSGLYSYPIHNGGGCIVRAIV